MSSDKPFVMRGGNDEQTALHNRIAAIERINYLTGIDLRKKSATFLKLMDLELWKRWYKDGPQDKKIDEEFCQRAAEVILAMEDKPVKLNKAEYKKAKEDFDANRDAEVRRENHIKKVEPNEK